MVMILGYTAKESFKKGKIGIADIEIYLTNQSETIEVINVENDEFYQNKDIDLIWKRKVNGQIIESKIEVKSDSYIKTGNYFIEIISNDKKNTLGCFLYTEADYYYYYFYNLKELHIMPMPESRTWFNANIHRFGKDVSTSTEDDYGNHLYNTIGKLVKKTMMQEEVPTIEVLERLNEIHP
ncbi:hypothetical protein [uncultured Methanolobus sp.]|uniref:hypothetical protein n=1 Tax=uncultured Methanolobus sp. TaxID=218300 RepID=UPI0029C6D453|nr:hypothetical protein [uncultured Methanolobus sp.]